MPLAILVMDQYKTFKYKKAVGYFFCPNTKHMAPMVSTGYKGNRINKNFKFNCCVQLSAKGGWVSFIPYLRLLPSLGASVSA